MNDKAFVKYAGNGIFNIEYRDGFTGQITRTEQSPYPVPYLGSVIPDGFRCYHCGGAVITDWIYYYGPELHPHIGQWGGKCLDCKTQFTLENMRLELNRWRNRAK